MEETNARHHINAANEYTRLYESTGNQMFLRLANDRRKLASKWAMFKKKWGE